MWIIKPKSPWHYLTWRAPQMIAEHEIALARLMRRRGMFYLVRIFWGVVTADQERYTLSCLGIFVAYNYPIFVCAAGYLLGIEDLWIAGAAWLVTFVLGTARYCGWLVWLLNRWPPLASG